MFANLFNNQAHPKTAFCECAYCITEQIQYTGFQRNVHHIKSFFAKLIFSLTHQLFQPVNFGNVQLYAALPELLRGNVESAQGAHVLAAH